MEFGLTLFTSDRGIRPTTAAVAAENAGFSAIVNNFNAERIDLK